MKRLIVLFVIVFMLGCGGGGSVNVDEALTIREPIWPPIYFAVGYEDNSHYSGRYMQIQNTDLFFRKTTAGPFGAYRLAGSLDELRAWFYETYEEIIPYWAIAFAVKFTDGTVEFWLPGKKTIIIVDGVEIEQYFFYPAMFFEQWMIYLNSMDPSIRHPHDWFGGPPYVPAPL